MHQRATKKEKEMQNNQTRMKDRKYQLKLPLKYEMSAVHL